MAKISMLASMLIAAISLTLAINLFIKIDELSYKKDIAKSLCQITEARFQVSATREALEYLQNSLAAIKGMSVVVTEQNISLTNSYAPDHSVVIPCEFNGRKDIHVYFLASSPYHFADLFDPTSFLVSLIICLTVQVFCALLLKRISTLKAKIAVSEAASALAHDIRVPFRVMETKIIALKGHEIDTAVAADLKVTLKNAKRSLANLIDDVLLSNGSMRIIKASFLLKELIEEAVSDALHETAGIKRLIAIDCNKDTLIDADKNKLKRVLINLISNAIIFTPESNKISIHVSKTSDRCHISVSNEGSFIPLWRRHFLFTTTKSTRQNGTGIGLLICKKIIEAHGGRIHCFSDKRKGTTFGLYLPMQDATKLIETVKHVILVEDDPFCLDLLRKKVSVNPTIKIDAFEGPTDFLEAINTKQVTLSNNVRVITDMYFESETFWTGNKLAEHLRTLGYQGHIVLYSDYVGQISPAIDRVIGKDLLVDLF